MVLATGPDAKLLTLAGGRFVHFDAVGLAAREMEPVSVPGSAKTFLADMVT